MNLTPEDRLASPLNLEELLLTTKQLEPLSEDAIVRLQKVQQLDVTDFNEAEVRSNIIDPIVRVLGYAKGTNYSANLERPLSILGKKLIPDYSLTLWDENFWLIEAKRPRIGKAAFEYDDVSRSS